VNAPESVPLDRSLVLIGLMGAGKSAVGRRLAGLLGCPFKDADAEIEAAAGCSVADFFARFGEAAFREGERKVMIRLLEGPPLVLAAGGGAFMDAETRAAIKSRAISIWLKADLDLLYGRTKGRGHRPLLNTGDPKATLARLMAERYPVYAEADITVDSNSESADVTARRVKAALDEHRMRAVPA